MHLGVAGFVGWIGAVEWISQASLLLFPPSPWGGGGRDSLHIRRRAVQAERSPPAPQELSCPFALGHKGRIWCPLVTDEEQTQ